jgi:hypothetical protein
VDLVRSKYEDIFIYRTRCTPICLISIRRVCKLILIIRTVYTPSIKDALDSQGVLLTTLGAPHRRSGERRVYLILSYYLVAISTILLR